jgi:hypothetical protein
VRKPYNLAHSLIIYSFPFYVCDSRKFGVYEVGEEDYICGEKNTMDFGPRLCHIFCVVFCLDFLDAKKNI